MHMYIFKLFFKTNQASRPKQPNSASSCPFPAEDRGCLRRWRGTAGCLLRSLPGRWHEVAAAPAPLLSYRLCSWLLASSLH